MAYIKHEETYSKQRENTIKNRTPQESQQVLQNLWSFLSQNMKKYVQWCQKFPKSPTCRISQKLQYIDLTTSSLTSRGRIPPSGISFNQILIKELESRHLTTYL